MLLSVTQISSATRWFYLQSKIITSLKLRNWKVVLSFVPFDFDFRPFCECVWLILVDTNPVHRLLKTEYYSCA